jgi:acyl-CoA hydrolase
MEVRVKVASIDEESGVVSPTALDCLMTMVARDPTTYQAAKVHKLEPKTKEEKEMFEHGKGIHVIFDCCCCEIFMIMNFDFSGLANVIRRREQSESSLNQKPPNIEETQVV